jgi:hypothetical protein
MRLIDIRDMPGFNPASNAQDKEQRDISNGKVKYEKQSWMSAIAIKTVCCSEHGAMNLVNSEKTIWRCLTCNVGAYDMDRHIDL